MADPDEDRQTIFGDVSTQGIDDAVANTTTRPTQGEGDFLGVPEDFIARDVRDIPSHGTPAMGDIFTPGQQGVLWGTTPAYRGGFEIDGFNTLSVEEKNRVRDLLVQGGYMSADQVRTYGRVWGANEQTAMIQVLSDANANGMTWEQVLIGAAASGQWRASLRTGGRSGGGGGGRRPTVRLSNPDDLRLAFRQAARGVTGGVFVEEDQIDRMVQAYQSLEAQEQNQVIEGAATVTQAPSPDAFAVTQLEELDPGGIEANRFAGIARVLSQITSGGSA